MRFPAFIENFLYKTDRVLGLEVQLLNDSDVLLDACVCVRAANSVSVPFTKSGSTSLDELVAALPEKKLPVALVITGKGIMHKKINVPGRIEAAVAFQKVFPSGNEQDFYTQVYYGAGDVAFASVIRRKKVDELIGQLQKHGLTTIDFFLGAFAAEDIFPLADNQAALAEWKWAGHSVVLDDKKIREYEFNPAVNEPANFSLTVIGVAQESLLAFGAAFHYFLPLSDLAHNNAAVHGGYDDFRNTRAFTKLGRTSLIFILLLCLGNFLLFSSYFNKQKKLDEELALYESAVTFHRRLNLEFAQKKDFLERSGLGFSTRTSYYVDRLMYDLPADIQLSYLSLFPLKNRIEKDSVIQFDPKKVLVKGFCEKSIVLNNWINLVKTKDFVADVVLDNYIQESEKEKGRFDLSVRLK